MNPKISKELPRPAPALKFDVTSALAGLVVGTIGPVCLAVWRTKPTEELFEAQRKGLASAVARDPGNVAFLCVVESTADPPDQKVRDASSAMISSHGKNLAAVACVIEGYGFRAAVTRTVLSGIALVTRNAAPTRYFEGVSAASAWLGERIPVLTSASLADQVELGRRHLDAAPSWR